jgi:hypothetical protein
MNGCIAHPLVCRQNPHPAAARGWYTDRRGHCTSTERRREVRRVSAVDSAFRTFEPPERGTYYLRLLPPTARMMLVSVYRPAYFVAVLPYPHGRTDLYRAALCLRENALVRKKPECWTCSWCVKGSETLVSTAFEAHQCKGQVNIGRKKQYTANFSPRAA